MSNEYEYDAEVDENGRATDVDDTEDMGVFDRMGNWCKHHKVLTVFAIVLFPVTLVMLGAKLFSTHTIIETQVEVPAPSCTDGYRKVPVHTETITHYEWVPEQQNEE